MADKEWQNFRNKIKKSNPDWDKCTCPKRCKANSLDEDWYYDNDHHVKHFVGAKFICSGCHWLKTPPWRVETWLQKQRGELPPTTKPPHIIDCLGWTQERVDKLMEKDLAEHQWQIAEQEKIARQVQVGKAEVRYWTVELSALSKYGYSEQEIADLEKRMNTRNKDAYEEGA